MAFVDHSSSSKSRTRICGVFAQPRQPVRSFPKTRRKRCASPLFRPLDVCLWCWPLYCPGCRIKQISLHSPPVSNFFLAVGRCVIRVRFGETAGLKHPRGAGISCSPSVTNAQNPCHCAQIPPVKVHAPRLPPLYRHAELQTRSCRHKTQPCSAIPLLITMHADVTGETAHADGSRKTV